MFSISPWVWITTIPNALLRLRQAYQAGMYCTQPFGYSFKTIVRVFSILIHSIVVLIVATNQLLVVWWVDSGLKMKKIHNVSIRICIISNQYFAVGVLRLTQILSDTNTSHSFAYELLYALYRILIYYLTGFLFNNQRMNFYIKNKARKLTNLMSFGWCEFNLKHKRKKKKTWNVDTEYMEIYLNRYSSPANTKIHSF